MNQRKKNYIKKLYYSVREPGSFTSLDTIYKRIKQDGRYNIKKKELLSFLQSQDLYTSHLVRQKLRKFAKVISPSPNYGIEFDSAVMPFAIKNKLKYAIVGIDIFTRKVGVRAVETLKAEQVNKAIIEIIDELGGGFSFVRTDKGTEYFNQIVKRTFKRLNMEHIPAFPPNKSVHAENLIRILKRKIYKVLQHFGDHKWPTYIQDVVYSYNHTKSTSLDGLSPSEIQGDVVSDLWFQRIQKDLKKQPNHKPFKFEIDDAVRIQYHRENAFKKEYQETSGARIYYIEKRYSPGQVHLYKLRNNHDEILPGRFKENELQKVEVNDDTIYRIEKIVSRRRLRNGVRQVKVRWLDYPERDDSWVDADEVEDLIARRG